MFSKLLKVLMITRSPLQSSSCSLVIHNVWRRGSMPIRAVRIPVQMSECLG